MTGENKKTKLKEKEIELIIARLEVISPDIYFASGNGSSISRDDMIKHVRNGDEVGNEFMETEMEFLRAMKDGKLLKQLISFQSPESVSFA